MLKKERNGIQRWRCCSIYQNVKWRKHQESRGDQISSNSSITVIPITLFPRTVSRRKKYTTHALPFSKREYQTINKRVEWETKKENRFRSAIPAPLGRRSQSFSLFFFHRGGTWGLRRVCSQPNGNSPMQKKTRLPVLTERRRERKARFVIRTQGE